MTKYNTGNPVGSADPRDLYDNAESLDEAVNSSADTFQDRLGKSRLTWAGIVKAGTGDPAIAVDAAARAEAAASDVEQNAEQIAQDAAQQAASAVIAGVDGAVDEAQGYAQQAETARDAAFVNADVYPDVATGLAAVADGEQFQVLSADGMRYIRYVRDNASSATEVAAGFPTAKHVNEIAEDTSSVIGGEFQIASASDFTEDEFIDPSGAVVPSSGYASTGFLHVRPGVDLRIKVYASANVARAAFYDTNQQLISIVPGSVVPSTEVTVSVPENAAFVRLSNSPSQEPGPEAFMIFSGIVEDKDLLSGNDIGIQTTDNLATPDRLIKGSYVKSDGQIATGEGWTMFSMDVEPSEVYTFGRFSITEPGYMAFHDQSGNVVSSSSFYNSDLPKTVTVPTGAAKLYFNVARPDNTSEDSEFLTVNVGGTLLEYEAPLVVVALRGMPLAGEVNPADFARLGADVDFGRITADSIETSALVANLPSGASLPAGVEIDQAWIDTTDGTIKVRLQ